MTIHPHFRRMHHLLYRTQTGEIFAYEASPSPILPVGVGSISVHDEGRGLSPTSKTHRVDIAVDPHVVVSLTEAERAQANLPMAWEIVHQISSELGATDQFMVPDRPMTDVQRAAWAAYRRALRDLSKVDTLRGRRRAAVEMVSDWPLRPDGSDPIPHFRSRI